MAEHVKDRPRLTPLGELDDYKVANGNPDIRGWEVYGADSLRIGEVRELIVDTNAMKARYMVVALDRTLPGVTGERPVIVAIGRARLDDALDRVYVDDVTVANANQLPKYSFGTWTEENERTAVGPTAGAYERPEYDANRFFGKRTTAPGDAYVVLHDERVDVEKRPVAAGESARERVIVTKTTIQEERIVEEYVPGEGGTDAGKKKEPV